MLIRRTGRRASQPTIEGKYSFGRNTRLQDPRFQGPNPPIVQHGFWVTSTEHDKKTYVFEAEFTYDRNLDVWNWTVHQGSTDIINGAAKRLGEAADDLLARLNSGEGDAVIRRRKMARVEW